MNCVSNKNRLAFLILNVDAVNSKQTFILSKQNWNLIKKKKKLECKLYDLELNNLSRNKQNMNLFACIIH